MESKAPFGDLIKKKISYNPFEVGPILVAVPSTAAQREIWASIKMDPQSTLCYNESLALELVGAVDSKKIDSAFQELLIRHDALRSVFSSDGKTFFVKEYSYSQIQTIDLSFHTESQSELERLKKAEVQLKLDLEKGPLFKGTLIKLNENKFIFLMTAHHIVCDGWSFAVLLNELSDSYSGISLEKTTVPQFADYAISEYKNGLSNAHKQYWLKEFARPLSGKAFPIDYKRPSFRTFNSERLDFSVNENAVKNLKKLGAIHGCSFYSSLISVFSLLMNKLSSSEDIVIGLSSASQPSIDQNNLVGHMVNLLPLRVGIDHEVSFIDFMKKLRSKMLDAFEHQEFSYGAIVKELKNIQRESSEIPLLNVVFNIDQQSLDQGLRLKGIESSYKTIARNFENFEIFINAVSRGNELVLECQYNSNLFSAATIENWLLQYSELIEKVAAHGAQSLKSFELPNLKISNEKQRKVAEEIKPLALKRHPEIEEKIKKVWSDVLLTTHPIKAEDNFFSIGGHSLLGIEVATLLQQEFKIQLSLRDIFEAPTIIMMANKLSETQTDEKENQLLPSMLHYPELEKVSVSHNQMQVWYLEEVQPQTTMHNLPASIRLKTFIDRELLERALQMIIKRHSALRTAIVIEDGIPIQKILNEDLSCFQIKLDLLKVKESDVVPLLNIEAQFVFDKDLPPMFRAKLFELGANDYVFFFMVHHAVWDGWSFDIFFEELNLIYSALVKKEEVLLKPIAVNYGDHTFWLNKIIEEKLLTKEIAYWEEKLKVPLPVLDLPVDFPRPLIATHIGATLPFTFSSEEALSLRQFAKDNGTSIFNVLLTAFKITLSRYTNLEDIIVGSPVRGRNSPEIMNTIGYFVNAVALRTAINQEVSFEENLKAVTQTCIEAFDNQMVPFQIILNKVNYNRDASRTPIFQTFFSYQDVGNRKAVLNGVPYTQINIDKASTHTDLDLWIKASEFKIEGAFEYRKDLFKEISIQRFKENFFFLLKEVTKERNTKSLHTLKSLSRDQEESVLKLWNKTKTDSDGLMAFHKSFEQNALDFPNAIAIENSKGSLTYGELNRLANRCANVLLDKGVGRGDLVGVSLKRGTHLIATLLGVLKSGAGYVPLDPGFPEERLDYMVESSKPKVLVTETELNERFSYFNKKILIEDYLKSPEYDRPLPKIENAKDDTIYVIYTSGSTGLPKGVQLTHGSVTNFLHSMKNLGLVSKEDKILAVTTLSFDIAVLELFLPLLTGGTVFLATSVEAMDGAALKTILQEKKITVMQATPSTWRLLLASGWKGNQFFRVLCGGEAFPIDLAKKLIPICGSVWNMYGPTETTVWSACKKLNLKDEVITVGKPIENTTFYILDDHLNHRPIGSTGQLFIGGSGLAKGYFGRGDLTRERFIDNPFVLGEKIYATGDLARFTADGEVECLGRNDGQVKVRGYRIELGEIEAQLQELQGISQAAAVTQEFRAGDIRIVAFLVGQAIEEKTIREMLSKKLPNYMIPSHFFYLKELPKTLNGKIDKKALPKIESAQKNSEKLLSILPANGTELSYKEELRAMWKDVLHLTAIDDTDNFFDVGGNSLIAVELYAKISLRFKLNLPLSLLVESANFHHFSNAVQSRLALEKNQSSTSLIPAVPQIFRSLVAINPNGVKNPLFCFHGVGGNVLNYVSLIPATKNVRPLLAFQSIGLDGVKLPLESIEEMAAAYLKEMKLAQPVGPYLLAGGSMGGMIALEVALQLLRSGESVEKLIMFDTFGPNLDLKSYSSKKSKRSFFTKLRSRIKNRLKLVVNQVQTNIYRNLGLPLPMKALLFDIENKNYRAIWKYRPEQYVGDLHLLRSKVEATGWYSDPLMGWKGIIDGEIKTYEIDGTHENFIESSDLVIVLSKLI